jgi:hypothetical protein
MAAPFAAYFDRSELVAPANVMAVQLKKILLSISYSKQGIRTPEISRN